MAFPTTPILDDFNRPDEGPPPSANWSTLPAVASHVVSALKMIGNSPIDSCVSVWNTLYGADVEAYFTLTTVPADLAQINLYIKYIFTVQDGWWIAVTRNDMAGDTISGDIVSAPVLINLQSGDAFGIQQVGTSVSVWYKPVGGSWGLIETLTSAPFIADGSIVIESSANNGGAPAVDDFGGGNYIPPGVVVGAGDACVECARLSNPFAPPAELDWYISPDGQSYQFDNARDDILLAFQGYGMPGIEYIDQQGPFQHGKTLLDYRLQPRIIQLEHRREGCDRYDYWTNRGGLLNILRPNRQLPNSFELGKLRKILPGNVKRDIDVLVQQGPSFAARNDGGDWLDFTDTIQFIAPDPTFYDPDEVTVVWTITVTGELFFYSVAFPNDLFFPISFGTDVLSGSASLHYTGTWLAFPTIVMTGPINQPIIENLTTGEKIQLVYYVAAGEVVTISLPFGNKTVTNNFGQNLIGNVSTDSDLATFHIAPEPEATWCGTHPRPCGVNSFSVSGGGGVAGVTTITMRYNTRFIGI